MKKIEESEIDVQYRLYEKDVLIRDWILIRDLSSLCKFRTRFKLEFKFKILIRSALKFKFYASNKFLITSIPPIISLIYKIS